MTERFELAHQFTKKWESVLGKKKVNRRVKACFSITWFAKLKEEIDTDFHTIASTCDGCNAWDNLNETFKEEMLFDKNIAKQSNKYLATLLYNDFWQSLNCENLPLPFGHVLYDSAISIGRINATKLLQNTCNIVAEAHLDKYKAIKVDGICGAQTITLCASLAEFGLDFYTARMLIRQRLNFYKKLNQNYSILNPFYDTWKQRCQDLLEDIAMLERDY